MVDYTLAVIPSHKSLPVIVIERVHYRYWDFAFDRDLFRGWVVKCWTLEVVWVLEALARAHSNVLAATFLEQDCSTNWQELEGSSMERVVIVAQAVPIVQARK